MRPMLTENKNFETKKLDASFVPSDKITCLQCSYFKGPLNNLQVYVSSIAMLSNGTDEPLNDVV